MFFFQTASFQKSNDTSLGICWDVPTGEGHRCSPHGNCTFSDPSAVCCSLHTQNKLHSVKSCNHPKLESSFSSNRHPASVPETVRGIDPCTIRLEVMVLPLSEKAQRDILTLQNIEIYWLLMSKCSPAAMVAAVCMQTALFQTPLRFAADSGGHIPAAKCRWTQRPGPDLLPGAFGCPPRVPACSGRSRPAPGVGSSIVPSRVWPGLAPPKKNHRTRWKSQER